MKLWNIPVAAAVVVGSVALAAWAATPAVCPRATGEGSIGSTGCYWGGVYGNTGDFKRLTMGGVSIASEAYVTNAVKVHENKSGTNAHEGMVTNGQNGVVLSGTITPTNSLTVTNSLHLDGIAAGIYLTNNHAGASLSGQTQASNLTMHGWITFTNQNQGILFNTPTETDYTNGVWRVFASHADNGAYKTDHVFYITFDQAYVPTGDGSWASDNRGAGRVRWALESNWTNVFEWNLDLNGYRAFGMDCPWGSGDISSNANWYLKGKTIFGRDPYVYWQDQTVDLTVRGSVFVSRYLTANEYRIYDNVSAVRGYSGRLNGPSIEFGSTTGSTTTNADFAMDVLNKSVGGWLRCSRGPKLELWLGQNRFATITNNAMAVKANNPTAGYELDVNGSALVRTNLVVTGTQTNIGPLYAHGGGNVATQGWNLAIFTYQGDGPVNGLTLLGSNITMNGYGVNSTANTDFNGGGRWETIMPSGCTQQVFRVKVFSRQDTTTNQVAIRPYHSFYTADTSTRLDTGGTSFQVTIPFTNAGSVWLCWTNTWGTATQCNDGAPMMTTLYRMQSSATGTVQLSSLQYRNILP